MAEYIMRMLSIPLYLFEGYCIQFFFCRFAEPRLCRLRNTQWIVGIVWILIRIANRALFYETDNMTLVVGLIFNTAVLFLFCVGWYRVTYAGAPEVMSSAIAAYEMNVLTVPDILK